MKLLAYKLLFLLFVFSGSVSGVAQNIDVLFTGIRSTKGQIIVSAFIDEKSFKDEKPLYTYTFQKKDIVQGVMLGHITIPPGTYGFALLDDENYNKKMEYNMLGMPEEGFAFSNFYLSGFKRPKYEMFKFTISQGQKLRINMKMRYL